MIHEIFSVYDSKAGAYTQPFYAVNRRVAIRMFSELANDPNHAFGMHPEDFTLFELGSFNDQDGTIDQLDVKTSALGKAMEYQRPEPGNGKTMEGVDAFNNMKGEHS